MFYFEIFLGATAGIISLVIGIYNAARIHRLSYRALLSSLGATCSAYCAIIVMVLLPVPDPVAGIAGRINLPLLLLIMAQILGFQLLYPVAGARTRIAALAAGLPAVMASAAAIAFGNQASAAGVDAALPAGAPFWQDLSLILISIYAVLSLGVILFKAFRHEYRAVRIDLLYLFAGLFILLALFLGIGLYLPRFSEITELGSTGILVSLPAALLFMNYAASNVKTINMKNFFYTAVYWFSLFLILFIPISAVLKFNSDAYLQERIHPLAVAVVIFLYSFIFFKYFRPRIEIIFQRENRELTAKMNELFEPLTQLLANIKQENFWDDFFKAMIGGIVRKFEIDGACFYLYSGKEKKFILTHSFGKTAADREIVSTGLLVDLLAAVPGIVYKPMLHAVPDYDAFKDQAYEYFENNGVEVVLPCLDPDKRIIGLIALGSLKRNRIYSKSFLSALELYRVQFQHHLANALMLEQVRATQIVEHDHMVVSSIKKKIIPQKMSPAEGFRLSSLYMNNSLYGGEYFDSIPIDADRTALFMSDTSYSGVDSAIMSLELYTVLHTPSRGFESPEKILGTINWVIATSRFTSRYASAFCAMLSSSGDMTCSSAAYNPVIVYDPEADAFTSLGTSGVPLGVDRGSRYESRTVRLNPGSIGMLYSDGLVSAINNSGENYGLDRVKVIIRHGSMSPPADLTRTIFDDLSDFIKERKQINDICAILFKYR